MHPPAPRPPRTVSAFLPAPRFLSSFVLRLLACLAFAGAVLAPRGAAAQFFDAGTTTTTNFDASDFFIGVQANPTDNLSDFDVARFFNKARCLCNQPVFIYVTLVSRSRPPPARAARSRSGSARGATRTSPCVVCSASGSAPSSSPSSSWTVTSPPRPTCRR